MQNSFICFHSVIDSILVSGNLFVLIFIEGFDLLALMLPADVQEFIGILNSSTISPMFLYMLNFVIFIDFQKLGQPVGRGGVISV